MPGVLANDDSWLVTWIEKDNLLKVWDLERSVLVKQIKSPVKSSLNYLQISEDWLYISHDNEVVSKYSLSEGIFISYVQGLLSVWPTLSVW
jgi:WD40 repeat protein